MGKKFKPEVGLSLELKTVLSLFFNQAEEE